ncbi:MAG TPA: hypothetical protein VHQ87_16180 [Rhizobacter sp.]|nr:hypothetical protein [Rhizobacter sp.]
MSTLTEKLSRWLGSGATQAERARWQQLAADTGATSQAEWHLSGQRGSVAWSLPSLFTDGETNPREEYLRWQATGLPTALQCEIVPRAQYEDWAIRSATHADSASSADTNLARALSAFAAETLGFEASRFVPWQPAVDGNAVVDPGDRALEEFAINWVLLTADPLTAEHLLSRPFQEHWVATSHLLTDAKGRPATDLRLRIGGGTAQLHTTRAHRNMPLEAVQSLVDLGLVLLVALEGREEAALKS